MPLDRFKWIAKLACVLSLLSCQSHGVKTIDKTQQTLHFEDGTEIVVIKRVFPEYPPVLRKARIQGKVLIRTTVLLDGTTSNISVYKSSNNQLDEYAVQAVSEWLFRYQYPTSTKPKTIILPLTFALDK